MLQPKALHFHSFILMVPCFPQFFGRPRMTNILLWGQLHHLFYQVCVKKTGFYDIPTHVHSRLTNSSSSTGSDYRYAIFVHDLMCSISANHCNMRQHRKGKTSSNTSTGGLDLLCKYNSNFPH